MIKHFCDRCQNPITNYSERTEITIRTGLQGGKEYDLCPTCSEFILAEITEFKPE
jgi:hypothetical protein